MKMLKTLLIAAACLAWGVGCSQETKDETRQALDETGDAIGSAAEDTRQNVKKAADAVKEGADAARESWEGDEAAPTTPPPAEPANPAP